MSRHRICDRRWCEPIARARLLLPSGVLRLVDHVEFVAGVDPVFAGYHRYGGVRPETAAYAKAQGREDRAVPRLTELPHCASPANLLGPRYRRVTTVFLPSGPRAFLATSPWGNVWTVLHELGHALDVAAGAGIRDVPSTTPYSTVSRAEGFAEGVAAWAWSAHGEQLHGSRFAAFLDHLAAD